MATRSKAQREADKRYDAKRKGKRHRVWMCIFYPDSMPDLVWEMLAEMHMCIWVSPLHDRDKWTKLDQKKNAARVAGTLKKPHFHLVVEYANAVSFDEFMADFGFLNGVDGKYVRDKVAMIRYLIHKDDEDKAQYSVDNMRTFGGADAGLVNEIGSGEEHEMLRSMRRYVRENDVLYFSDFVDYCDDCQLAWARLLDNKCYAIKAYIADRRNKFEDGATARAAYTPRCFVCGSADVVLGAVGGDGSNVYACEEHSTEFYEYEETFHANE